MYQYIHLDFIYLKPVLAPKEEKGKITTEINSQCFQFCHIINSWKSRIRSNQVTNSPAFHIFNYRGRQLDSKFNFEIMLTV